MPDFDDSLGGHTLGGDNNEDRFEKSLGDERTMGGDTDVNSLGDASTMGDANIEDDWGGGDIKLVDLSTRYTEEGVLGKGGMGEVLLATDTVLDRKVAIKRILGKAARSKTASQRFLTEAKSIAALNHNNIVQIYDYGRSTAGPFLIMECVQGGSLLDKCKEGPIELEEAVNIFSQLCDGLAKAHAANIIHRDIKPANVLISEDGVPKLTDFGLAKDDTADTGMTVTGAVMGTFDFMPPEQREGAHLTDHRSDLWSLAATFYQMLTGKSPKIIKFSDIPAKLQDFLGRALEDDKDDRYQSALEMREAVLQAHSGKMDASRTLGEGECPECGVLNPPDRKFCRECTATLQVPCLKCQVLIPIWDKGCGECGVLQKDLLDRMIKELENNKVRAEHCLVGLDFKQAKRELQAIEQQTDPRFNVFVNWRDDFSSRLKAAEQIELTRLKEILLEALAHEKAYDYEAGIRALEQIAPPLLNTVVEGVTDKASVLKDRLEKRQARLQELEKNVREHIKKRELTDLLPLVEELLSLKPNRPQVEKLRIQLVSRKDAIAQRHKETITKAKQYTHALKFDEVIDALNSLAEDERTSEIQYLLNQASTFAQLKELALRTTDESQDTGIYENAIANIGNYLSEIAKAGIKDPKLKLLYDNVKSKHSASIRKGKLIKLGVSAATAVAVLIAVLIVKLKLDSNAIDIALAKGDWETVLEISPGNSDGLRLKALAENTAALNAAIADGNWQLALELEPDNKTGLRLKEAFVNEALDKGDWRKVLDIAPNNPEALLQKASHEQVAAEIQAALFKGDWESVLALEPAHPAGLQLKADRALQIKNSLNEALLAIEPSNSTKVNAPIPQAERFNFIQSASDSGNGKHSTLKTKLVTHRGFQSLYPEPDSGTGIDAEPLGPFSVFHQIQTDDGKTEEGGFYRVGNSQGVPLGWVKKQDVAVWNTRCVLQPIDSNISDGDFTVYNIGKIGAKRTDARAILSNPPAQNKLRLAFILSPPEKEEVDDTIYEVLCLDRTVDQSTGGVEDIRKKIQDISVEIVFVYEATDALEWVIGGESLKNRLQTVMRNVAASFDEAGVSDMVRFGIVGFQDNTSHSQTDHPKPFGTRVIHPLTPGSNAFVQGVDKMVAYPIGGDWPEDGLSGIAKAMDMLEETKYSSKHIIYYGMSAPHQHGRGEAHPEWGGPRRFSSRNLRSDFYDTSTGEFTGYTQSGLTVKSITDRAAPRPGDPLSSKTIHTIMNVAEHWDIIDSYTKEIVELLRRLEPQYAAAIQRSNNDNELIEAILRIDAGNYEPVKLFNPSMQAEDYYRSQSKGVEVLKSLAVNTSGNFKGFNGTANATPSEYERVLKELFESLNKIVPVLVAAKNGDPEAMVELTSYAGMGESEFTSGSLRVLAQQSVQELLGEDATMFWGSAPVRDDDGHLVAHKSVLVSKEELEVFVTRLGVLTTLLEAKVDLDQRSEFTLLLEELQICILELLTGEQLQELSEVKRQELIKDLPFKTPVLELSVSNLKTMQPNIYQDWLNRLKISSNRCAALLEDSSRWSSMTESSPQSEIGTVLLSDIP